MPTAIPAGASASVTVPTGYTLSLSGQGVAVVANRAITQAISGSGTLGPWNYDQAVYVTASTAMTYDLMLQAGKIGSLTLPTGAAGFAGVTVGGRLLDLDGFTAAPGAETVGGVSYDGANRVTAYTADGVGYTVAYPSSTSIIVTGGSKTVTITLDGAGRAIGKVVEYV